MGIPPFPPAKGTTSDIIYGVDKTVGRGIYFMENVKEKMDIFFDKNAPSIVVEVIEYRDGYLNIRNRGGKIRAFTEITKENVSYCKDLINLVDELRHLDGVRGGVAVSEAAYMATTVLQERTPLTQGIYSNIKEVIEQGQYVFDTMWRAAIPAEKKIKEIEEGIIPEVIESINDYVTLQNKIDDLLRSTKEEILIVFSTSNAFHRQERAGSIQILKEKLVSNPNVKIKMLTPKDEKIEETCKELANSLNFHFRFINPLSQVSILVIDRKYSIVAELKDDTKYTSAEAIGFATYSNSLPTVLTYASIFHVIWKQVELYEQLKVHDRMQKEFINIAAHELRTPIQPIINIASFIRNRTKDQELREFLDILNRNAKKLKKLSEDILDITKMESDSLMLNKEDFTITEIVSDMIKDYTNNTADKNIQITCVIPDTLVVHGDKNRISQVISNLINNSIKFSSEVVSITIKAENKVINTRNKNSKEMIVIKVKDAGVGIDTDVFYKLFTKFTTTSYQGIGLGLYISKKIVEAHDGDMWAENNKNGTGATFSFSLPI